MRTPPRGKGCGPQELRTVFPRRRHKECKSSSYLGVWLTLATNCLRPHLPWLHSESAGQPYPGSTVARGSPRSDPSTRNSAARPPPKDTCFLLWKLIWRRGEDFSASWKEERRRITHWMERSCWLLFGGDDQSAMITSPINHRANLSVVKSQSGALGKKCPIWTGLLFQLKWELSGLACSVKEDSLRVKCETPFLEKTAKQKYGWPTYWWRWVVITNGRPRAAFHLAKHISLTKNSTQIPTKWVLAATAKQMGNPRTGVIQKTVIRSHDISSGELMLTKWTLPSSIQSHYQQLLSFLNTVNPH